MQALTLEERGLWRAWQTANPKLRSPFFHIGFAEAVEAVSRGVWVAKIYRADELVGFFAYQRRGSTAYPAGAPMNDYHGVISAVDIHITLEEVLALLPVKRLSVNSWIGAEAFEQPLQDDGMATCQVVLGDGGYEGWLEERRNLYKKYFKDKARTRRGMEANLGEVQVVSGSRDPDLLDQLIALKQVQYRRTGRHDIFGPRWTRDLLKRLMGGEELKASIAGLWAGDTLLALEYSLHAGEVWHFWFPGYFDVGARYSPGIWLSLETIRQESLNGYREFDYGFTGESYKKYFTNQTQQVVETVVGREDWAAKLGAMSRRRDLALSIRRRWSAIEAVETGFAGRAGGMLLASRSLIARLGRGES